MTLPKPIFDAAGLALFLQAHVMRAGALAADLTPDLRANDPARRNAERGERARLRARFSTWRSPESLSWQSIAAGSGLPWGSILTSEGRANEAGY